MQQRLCALAFLVLLGTTSPVLNAGTLWELSMSMEGMNFAMPKQRVCMDDDPQEPPPPDKECTMLEQSSSGNRHRVRAQCPDGLIEIDQTRTDTTLKQLMTMTDRSGESTRINVTGVALGPCDYAGEERKRQAQMDQMQQQMDLAMSQSTAQLKSTCDDALQKMQGALFGKDSLCPEQKAEFCRRLDTPAGYSAMVAGIPRGMRDQPQYGLADQLAVCGFSDDSLRARHCATSAAGSDFGFVGQFCPREAGALCARANEAQQYDFVFRHCPAEKTAFVAANCAGRQYSSQIDASYRDLCVAEIGEQGFGNDGSAGRIPSNPADAVGAGVKEGMKGLKKVFGL
jgi:hypothetical protein